MKQIIIFKPFFLLFGVMTATQIISQPTVIPLQTRHHAIVLQTDNSNRLRMIYSGKPLQNASEYATIASGYHLDDDNAGIYNAAYTPAGSWNLSVPAIEVLHADGNSSLELTYLSHQTKQTSDGASLTRIVLKDPVYPFTVTLCYKLWIEDDVIQQWTEIQHNEKEAVILKKYVSPIYIFPNPIAILPHSEEAGQKKCSRLR